MSSTGVLSSMVERKWPGLLAEMPTVAEAAASLLRTIIVALFVLTFVMDPCMIPSASMEPTLRVGDFLLSNRQVFAPAGSLGRWILPYRQVHRGDIVVFYHANPSLLVKRVVAVPGDRLRVAGGHVYIDGVAAEEPYALVDPPAPLLAIDDFPASSYNDPDVDPEWWAQMQKLTRDGQLTVPAGEYFVLGDNREHSDDSRFWGLVPRQAIFAKPLVIYFSLKRPDGRDEPPKANDKLETAKAIPAKLTGFARWNRIFHVVQ